jgi:hypothetical protein
MRFPVHQHINYLHIFKCDGMYVKKLDCAGNISAPGILYLQSDRFVAPFIGKVQRSQGEDS